MSNSVFVVLRRGFNDDVPIGAFTGPNACEEAYRLASRQSDEVSDEVAQVFDDETFYAKGDLLAVCIIEFRDNKPVAYRQLQRQLPWANSVVQWR